MPHFFCYFWLIAFSLVFPVSAEDLITSRAVLQDKAGTLTIERVIHEDFLRNGGILSKGYTDTVHWLRLTVKAPGNNGPVELRIRPTFLDDVQLYEPDAAASGGWKKHVTGDQYAFAQRERAAITLGFVIHPAAPETTYYLRLKTSSTSILYAEALTPYEAKLKDMYLDLSQVFYLGIMFWLLFWALYDYIDSRQSVTAWFLLYQASYIIYDLSLMGYLAPLMPGDLPRLGDQLTKVVIFSTVWLSIAFHRNLFQLFSPSFWLLRTVDALLFCLPPGIAALAWNNPREALQMNSLVVLFVAVVYLALALSARQETPPGRRALRIVYALHFASILASMLPILGWIDAIEWNLHATLIHGLISGSLMFWILHLRSRQIVKAGQEALLDLELTRQQLKLEQAQKKEQSRFINMLTHELKTPLSVLRMVIGAPVSTGTLVAQARRAVQDMNNVIEHCAEADKLADNPRALHFAPVLLMQELDELLHNKAVLERIDIELQAAPVLTTDVQMLRIILSNLLDNALKYSPQDSVVKITVSQDGQAHNKNVSILIENLPGVAGWPDPAKIFEKYYRSPAAHHQIGTGLGLYLIENMARQLGGKISYTPDDIYIRFNLWLPA